MAESLSFQNSKTDEKKSKSSPLAKVFDTIKRKAKISSSLDSIRTSHRKLGIPPEFSANDQINKLNKTIVGYSQDLELVSIGSPCKALNNSEISDVDGFELPFRKLDDEQLIHEYQNSSNFD